MALETVTRNPAVAKLESLDRCRGIRPFRAGDELLLCGNDMIPILESRTGWVHDPETLRRLRASAIDLSWPR